MAHVPIIDVGPLQETDHAGVEAVVTQVAAAAAEFGFFQIINHGISDDQTAEVWEQTRRFFELERPAKLAILRSKGNSRGYYDRELTKNARDLKEVFDFAHVSFPDLEDEHPRNFAPVDGHNQWPADLSGFKEAMMGYLDSLERVAKRLLGAFSLGLDQPVDLLHEYFGNDHTSFVRLNHYPLGELLNAGEAAVVAALGDMALHHHSDAGAFTLLLQDDVGGLQVDYDDTWIDVQPVPGALVVNTGDMMQVWSNDRYPAALHRVVSRSSLARYSLPYFFNPSYATNYQPLPGLDGAPHYRPINWGDFRQARADGDYADYGTEIQISQFRTG